MEELEVNLKSRIKEGFDKYVEGCYTYHDKTGHTEIKHSVLNELLDEINGRVLDVGTGGGPIAIHIAEACEDADVHGIDISDGMIDKAINEIVANKNVNFLVDDAENLSFENNSFDVVTTCMFLPWVVDKEKMLKELSRVCKDSGKIIFIEEDWYAEPEDVKHIVPHHPDKAEKFKLLSLSTRMSLAELTSIMKGHGYSLKKEVRKDVDDVHYMAGLVFTKGNL